MNYKDVFENYGNIPPVRKEKYMYGRILYSPFRYLMRRICTQLYFPYYFRKYTNLSHDIAHDTIVSLTSFPKRFSNLWLVIESLKHQTIKPEKILLYLSNQEVNNKNDIPVSLLNEEDDLFEIRFRDGKLRAHGKYYYAMCDFPNKNVVTVDDDVIYAPDMLEFLLKGHYAFPNDVITNHSYQIILKKNGDIKSYNEWKGLNSDDFNSGYCTINNLIPMGVSGALYPSNVLYGDVLNFDIAKDLSYLADDLWLYSQTVLSGNKVVLTSFNNMKNIPVYIKDNITLTNLNVGQNQNDIQINKLRRYYLKKLNIDIISNQY